MNGVLAAEAGYKLPVIVCSSANGFYLGTFDRIDGPVSRESAEYFATRDEAQSALNAGAWTQRDHP